MCKDIVVHLLDRVFGKIDEKDEHLFDLKNRRDELIGKKRQVDKAMKEVKHRSAVKIIRDEMLERLVMELAFETVKENMYISKKIDYKMVDILTKALQLERNSDTNADDLKILAGNVENEELMAAREALMNQFKDGEQYPVD
jgi:hypothetical protein